MNIIHLSYITLIFVILIVIFKIYIKCKFKFWANQPVFHYFNLFYWISKSGIINSDLPLPNKYCNFININTTTFEVRKERENEEIVAFLQTHYLKNNNCKYTPTIDSYINHFIGSNISSLISTYYKSKLLYDNNLSVSEHKEIIGIMTTKPINITMYNNNNINNNSYTFKAFYVDNLCVHNDYRKQGIAPQIIQTHEYIQRHKYKDINVSLFKREDYITGIVPLTKYMTTQFDINCINKLQNLHASMQIIEINKKNISLFITYISNKKLEKKCFILPDIGNLINLVNTNNIKIYGIIYHNNLIACYIFRNSNMTYHDKNVSMDFFASLSSCPNINIFIQGFTIAFNQYNKLVNAKYINIENISDNYIIFDYLYKRTSEKCITSPTAYFFYNYKKKPLQSKDVFILC